MKNMIEHIKQLKTTHRIFVMVTLGAGALAFILALIPGDFSLLSVMQQLADATVRDNKFETVDIVFYNRLRPFVFWISIVLLFAVVLAAQGVRKGRGRLIRWGTAIMIGVYVLAGVAVGELAAQRLNSRVYGYLLTGEFSQPPPPAPVANVSIGSTATPVASALYGAWQPIVSELSQPLVLTHAGDGSGRLFVGERAGVISVIDDGVVLPEPFLDLSDKIIVPLAPEQGLLGLAFHPNYAENGYVFVSYIDRQGNSIISRYQVSASDPNRVDPTSEYPIFSLIQLHEDHNGGNIVFGSDGYLYMSFGDGGLPRDPYNNAQSIHSFFGKILRVDVDGAAPYDIPEDNPFFGAYGRSEIWVYGLRNPWRFSFDSLTGDMYIGDVGLKNFDEISFLPAGQSGVNFGWNVYEGSTLFPGYPGTEPPFGVEFEPPIWEYAINKDGTCALIGGYVYRGEAIPDLYGSYVFGDFCSGLIWKLDQNADGNWDSELIFDTPFIISSFGVDEAGELYLTDFGGKVYQLAP